MLKFAYSLKVAHNRVKIKWRGGGVIFPCIQYSGHCSDQPSLPFIFQSNDIMHMIDIMKMYLSEGWIFLRISLMPLFSENFFLLFKCDAPPMYYSMTFIKLNTHVLKSSLNCTPHNSHMWSLSNPYGQGSQLYINLLLHYFHKLKL